MSKLFDKWELDEVKIEDLGLVKYICLDETLVPHTSGRHVKRQFAKSKVSIIERLMNKIMRTHINSGKKNKAYNIVKDALDIINKLCRSEQESLETMPLCPTFVKTLIIEELVTKERFSNGRVCPLCWQH